MLCGAVTPRYFLHFRSKIIDLTPKEIRLSDHNLNVGKRTQINTKNDQTKMIKAAFAYSGFRHQE